MVSDKVEIITKSYRDGAQAQHWTCDGSPEFTLEETEKADRGTDIVCTSPTIARSIWRRTRSRPC